MRRKTIFSICVAPRLPRFKMREEPRQRAIYRFAALSRRLPAMRRMPEGAEAARSYFANTGHPGVSAAMQDELRQRALYSA